MNFKDQENRGALSAEATHQNRQKAEDTHNHRQSQDAEQTGTVQRQSHAKYLENRPANTHPFDCDGKSK
jgi:hypothetical protein